MENIVKNRTGPCFVFRAAVLVTGVALVLLPGLGLGALITNPMLGVKFLLLVLIAVFTWRAYQSVTPYGWL